jgi:hypothetical protein
VTRPHFGIVLVILGTILLAFAVKVRSSRELIVVGSSIVATEATNQRRSGRGCNAAASDSLLWLGASVVNIVDNAPPPRLARCRPRRGTRQRLAGRPSTLIRQGESLMR